MVSDIDAARLRAEARSKKDDERRREGAKALTEHDAANRALRDKTVRLKALRLAKEAADTAAAAAAPPPVKKRASPQKKVAAKAT